MTTASTHTGICQACGRRQAVHVNTGLIAKHGYTTEYGFFNGTCGGSDALPLELDTKVNLQTVNALYNWAAAREDEADADIVKVLAEVGPYKFDSRHRRYRDTKLIDRAEFEATQPHYANFDKEVERVRFKLRRQAEIARANASELAALREKVHGQPLQPRKVESEIKREYFNNYRDAALRVTELSSAGVKARQRREQWGRQFVVTYR